VLRNTRGICSGWRWRRRRRRQLARVRTKPGQRCSRREALRNPCRRPQVSGRRCERSERPRRLVDRTAQGGGGLRAPPAEAARAPPARAARNANDSCPPPDNKLPNASAKAPRPPAPNGPVAILSVGRRARLSRALALRPLGPLSPSSLSAARQPERGPPAPTD